MFIIESNIKLRGLRHVRRLHRPTRINRKVGFFVKKSATQHNLYHKTQYTKFAHMGLVRLDAIMPRWYFYCVEKFYLKTRYGAVFKNPNGSFFAAPLVDAIEFGGKVSWLRNTYKKFFFLYVGVIARLRFLKLATLVSNVGYSRPVFATARGTFAKVRLVRPRSVTLILPSGKWHEFTRHVTGIVGRNAGHRRYKEVLGKASESFYNTKRIAVRSCAKNPVDHPNGGRTRGKVVFKTPWGKIAKRGK